MIPAQISDLPLTAPGMLYKDSIPTKATAEAAAAARDVLADVPSPLFVAPGNHDTREGCRTAFADHGYLPESGPLH